MNKPHQKDKVCTICGEAKAVNLFARYIQDLNRCKACHMKIQKEANIEKERSRKARHETGDNIKAPKREAYKDSGCRKDIENILEDIKFSDEWDYI